MAFWGAVLGDRVPHGCLQRFQFQWLDLGRLLHQPQSRSCSTQSRARRGHTHLNDAGHGRCPHVVERVHSGGSNAGQPRDEGLGKRTSICTQASRLRKPTCPRSGYACKGEGATVGAGERAFAMRRNRCLELPQRNVRKVQTYSKLTEGGLEEDFGYLRPDTT